MYKTVCLMLLLAHVLGDYIFQTHALSNAKRHQADALRRHCLIYAAACLICCLPVLSVSSFVAALLLAVCHTLIDYGKYRYLQALESPCENMAQMADQATQKLTSATADGHTAAYRPQHIRTEPLSPVRSRRLYLLDQGLHLLSILLIALIFVWRGGTLVPLPFLEDIGRMTGLSGEMLLRWLLLLLLIGKPSNITIKALLTQYKPADEDPAVASPQLSSQNAGAGAFIGLLERLVMLVLLSIQQYAAIGLVLTAKSIARYDRISKERAFAEYYLLGTLLSTAFILIAYLLIF